MPGLMRRLGGERLATEYRVYDAFAAAAGELLRARARPESFRNGTLWVRVESSPLAHELTLLRAPLVERMARELGAGVVTDIRTTVGPITADPLAAAEPAAPSRRRGSGNGSGGGGAPF